MSIRTGDEIGATRPWAVVGARLDFDFGNGMPANHTYEVRAAVDGEYLFVRRYVRSRNRGWAYELMHESYLASTYRAGNLSVRYDG